VGWDYTVYGEGGKELEDRYSRLGVGLENLLTLLRFHTANDQRTNQRRQLSAPPVIKAISYQRPQ
jgi:hypothetical protein